MKIYHLFFDQRFEQVYFKDDKISELLIWEFRGKIIDNIPENIQLETSFHGDTTCIGDIYNDGSKMYIPERTYELLYEDIKDHVQFIEAEHDKFGKCYILNVISVLDDDDMVKYLKYWETTSGNPIYIFKENINFPNIFKVKNDNGISTFVSDQFKQVIDKYELKGLTFDPIWDTESK